ncbi:hypothetical protein D3C76_1159400 [compost metagenome]
MKHNKGFMVVNLQSGSESEVYETYAEAEEARIAQVEENLGDDARYLIATFNSVDYVSPTPAHPDYKYFKALELNPVGYIEEIARRRGLDVLLVSPVED